MGKSKGVSKRRRKNKSPKFVHRSKLKKQRIKIMKKPTTIDCKSIRESWDPNHNFNFNIKSMGLSLNPNKTLAIHNDQQMGSMDANKVDNKKNKKRDHKSKVVSDLEEIANKPQQKNFCFGPENVKFCVYMIEKYGDDYKAMARDRRNYYQESVGQIRQKIKKFKSIPNNWNPYIKAKEMTDKEMDTSCADININDND